MRLTQRMLSAKGDTPLRIIVVYEDGDRTSRVEALADEVRTCVKNGSMRVLGVCVEVQHEDEVR